MRQVIGDVLPFAVVVMVSPINIVAAILLLFSKRALLNASSYLGGFFVGLTIVVGGLTTLATAISLGPGSGRLQGASILLLVLGAGLIVVAIQKYRDRPGPDEPASLPGWMDGIAGFSAGKSFAVGAAIGAGNPKNIAVALGTAVTVSSAGLPSSQKVAVLAVYIFLACIGVATPIVTMLVLGDRADTVLDGWKSWLTHNNAAMMAVIYLFFGVFLIGKNLAGV